jgi:hypothetical protein
MNAIQTTANLIALAAMAKRVSTPAIYAARVQRAKELITVVCQDRKIGRLAAAVYLAKQVPACEVTAMWLAAAVAEMTE